MIFTKRLRDGVRRGEITSSVRIWVRPRVVVGHRYRMEEGEIEIDSLLPISLSDLTPHLARESGFKGLVDLIKVARHGKGHNVYLVRFHFVHPGAAGRSAGTTTVKRGDPVTSRPRKAVSRGVSVEEAFKLASALPGVQVGTSWGTPSLKVKGRFLARLKEDGESLALRIGILEREDLMAEDPEVFYITDHYLNYPAVLVRLPKVRKAVLERVLTEAWRGVAPAGLQSTGRERRPGALARRRKTR